MNAHHDTSGPAFPHGAETGITVRDYFFAASLQAVGRHFVDGGSDAEEIVERAFTLADEAILQREVPVSLRRDLAREARDASRRASDLEAVLLSLHAVCERMNADQSGDPPTEAQYLEAMKQAEGLLDDGIPF
jgi:hypothetical protein